MKPLLFAATALPLICASAASAETKISTARTTGIATATAANGARDDVTIEKAGSIKLGQAGVAVALDSSNKVRNDGDLLFEDKDNATGVQLSPVQGNLENNGSIRLLESYAPADADKDGDLDGSFAAGTSRFGVRLAPGGVFTGSVVNGAAGSITVEGHDSAGILLQGRLQGTLENAGSVTVAGDRSLGVSAADVTGNVKLTGAVTVAGTGAVAVSLGNVGGQLLIQNSITATGYRSTERLADAARAKLDADDLRQGGAAVRVAGNVGGGILLDRPPADTKADDADEDKDGTADANERTAAVTSYGAAPALDLGGASATSIGRVGTGDHAYGLVIKGAVRGAGVNDGVAATGIRIGQPGGGTTTVENGMNIFAGGAVTASAYGAAASALILNAGARAEELNNGGEVGATVSSEGAHNATALLVEAGATMRTVRNAGTLASSLSGEAGDAAAIVDRSGTLALVENTGKILARITPTDDATDKDDADTNPANEKITGRAVAADLRANAAGAVVRQARASATAALPAMEGDLLFGAGADRLELLAGTYVGTISFGAGADSLVIDGGASAVGRLLDDDDRLAVDVRKGSLTVTNGSVVRLSSLNVSADGKLAVAIDPTAGTATRFEVSGNAAIASGGTVELSMTALSRGERSFEVLRAGSLTVGNVNTGLTGAPYMYRASLRQDAAAKALYVDLRPKSAAELELNRSGAQAHAAVFDGLDRDKRIEAAFLGARTRDEFLGLYNQMLPDHSGASLMSAASIASAISSALDEPLRGSPDDERGLAVWGQEILFNIDHDAKDATGFESKGVGFAAGIEHARGDHAVGVALSFVSTDYKDAWAAADEQVSMQFAQASAYWRTAVGRFKANARAGLGYVWFDGDRKLVSERADLDLTARADWNGWLADAHAGASYDLGSSWFVARPEVTINYLYLSEEGYRESGAGTGFDLEVDSRNGDLLTGTAALAVGARFGSTFKWGPEVKAGWRQRLAGGAGATTARFVSGGPDFTLSPEDAPDGESIVHLAFRGETDGISFSIEGGTAFDGGYQQYDFRAVARFAF